MFGLLPENVGPVGPVGFRLGVDVQDDAEPGRGKLLSAPDHARPIPERMGPRSIAEEGEIWYGDPEYSELRQLRGEIVALAGAPPLGEDNIVGNGDQQNPARERQATPAAEFFRAARDNPLLATPPADELKRRDGGGFDGNNPDRLEPMRNHHGQVER